MDFLSAREPIYVIAYRRILAKRFGSEILYNVANVSIKFRAIQARGDKTQTFFTRFLVPPLKH